MLFVYINTVRIYSIAYEKYIYFIYSSFLFKAIGYGAGYRYC